MIPTEDNYIDWILFGIKEYFRRINYRVLTYSIGQVKERQCPIDRILAVGNKIIGLQFKRPASEERPWRWKRTPHQHEMISCSRWIFYCLPDFVDLSYQEVALYHCRFVSGSHANEKYINGDQRYYRWGALANSLIGCQEGLQIDENIKIEQLINDMVENPHGTYLLMNRLFEEIYIIRDIQQPNGMENEPA